MLKTCFFLLVGFVLLGCANPGAKIEGITINENTEWSNTWIVKTNDTILPKVLLVGDSHVERYYGVVAKKLGDSVACSKFTTSKSLGDPVFIKQLEAVLMVCDYDVISFNNGLHGEDYEIGEYSRYVQIAHELLSKNARKSVIWVNSTAIRVPDDIAKFGPRNEQIIERNKYLLDFTKDHNLTLVDFYAATADSLNFYTTDGTHFNQAGVEAEAELIARRIGDIL